MSQEENNKPNSNNSKQDINIRHRIEETKNYSEKMGDLIKSQDDNKQYAKPFINEIVKPKPNPNNSSNNTSDKTE